MWQPRLWCAACGAGSTNHYAGDPISSILPSKTEHDIGLFGGLCGLTPRRRRQPGSGATRSESVFPTKREGPARGRRRHAVVAEALVPPGAARVATVYTNDQKRLREVIFADLCTLFCPHGCSCAGRGHGSHDVDGPMALVGLRCSDLRPTPRGSDATIYPHELTKPS